MAQQQWIAPVNAGAPWQTASGTTLSTAATATLYRKARAVLVPTRRCSASIRAWSSASRPAASTPWAPPRPTRRSRCRPRRRARRRASGTSLATTGALALPVSVTGLTWRIDAAIQVRAMAQGTGTATLYTHGDFIIQTAVQSGTPPTCRCGRCRRRPARPQQTWTPRSRTRSAWSAPCRRRLVPRRSPVPISRLITSDRFRLPAEAG